MNTCPPRDQLEHMLAGDLAAATEEVLCNHVEGCLGCQKVLDLLVSQNLPRGQTAHARSHEQPAEQRFVQHLREKLSGSTPFPLEHARVAAESTLGLIETCREPDRKLPSLPGYEILRELGRGGMGVVYRARQVALNRIVAVKMILAGEHADARLRSRFRVEAEAAAALQHPNIVQVHEVGEHDGRPFFSMEFIDGGSLQERLQGRRQPARAAAGFIETLARAVQFAHEHNIVHRDLKPSNILSVVSSPLSVAETREQRTSDNGQRHSEDRGFRLGQGTWRRDAAHANGGCARDAQLHGAGTGRGTERGSWSGGGHLRAGSNPILVANRPAALYRENRPGDAALRGP